ncbi:Tripartite tricarboxylate transporter family receptor [compost metagenome]
MLPNVPTVAEQGVAGYETEIWIGFYAPAGTPPDVVARLNRLAVSSMNEPGFKDTLLQQGTTPGQMAVPEFRSFVSTEIRKWAGIVKDARIEPQ